MDMVAEQLRRLPGGRCFLGITDAGQSAVFVEIRLTLACMTALTIIWRNGLTIEDENETL
jgi:hypothetical protein